MTNINLLAAVIAGVVGYFPGGLWYSKAMFLNRWAREMGVDLDNPPERKHAGLQIVIGLAASIAAAIVFALIAGPAPELHHALALALACAGGLIGTSFAVQYIYEGRSPTFWLINMGYHLLQFCLFALVLSLWP